MPNSHKSRGEFGIREIHYVNYRYAVVGEIAIGFSANRVQKASYPMPNSYRSRGEFGIREIRYVSYPYAVVGEMAKRFHLMVLSLKVCKYSFYSLSFHSFFIFSSFHFLN